VLGSSALVLGDASFLAFGDASMGLLLFSMDILQCLDEGYFCDGLEYCGSFSCPSS